MTTTSTFYTGRRSGIGYDKNYQMTTNAAKADKGIQITASTANSVSIYVGASGVTANSADATDGYPVAAGESVLFPVRNATEIFVIAAGSATAQKVWWMIV
tara:strand:+ start:103 stop:405 length:303 start_codon:yes stop_codon:yes gene_type:complete